MSLFLMRLSVVIRLTFTFKVAPYSFNSMYEEEEEEEG